MVGKVLSIMTNRLNYLPYVFSRDIQMRLICKKCTSGSVSSAAFCW